MSARARASETEHEEETSCTGRAHASLVELPACSEHRKDGVDDSCFLKVRRFSRHLPRT